MGRPNYTNRKIEGVKLGQAVAKDLLKRTPPGLGSKAAFRDPVVELDVSGKALETAGLREIVPALVASIEYSGENGRVVKLEELCLRDNKLDISSLPALSQVIERASEDLIDLDLSHNLINVSTEGEAAIFESFLRSFADCCVLRRLDLSENTLSPRAFEVLTKVYGQEPAVDLITADYANGGSVPNKPETQTPESTRKVSKSSNLSKRIKSLSIAYDSHEQSGETSSNGAADSMKLQDDPKKESKSPIKSYHASLADEPLSLYRNTKGLRSIPYIILSDTGMTETCALHLSCVVQHHGIPEQLLAHVPPAKAGTSMQQLVTYDSETQCRGIVYLPNPQIGSAGMNALQLAEVVRKGLPDEIDAASTEASRTSIRPRSSTPRVSDSKSSSLRSIHGPRSIISAKDIDYDDSGIQSVMSELERARHRIQGNTLRDAGPLSSELWRTALKLLCLGRAFCPSIREELSITKTAIKEQRGALQEISDRATAPPEPTFASAVVSNLAQRPKSFVHRSPNQPLTLRLGQEWRNGKLVLTPIPSPVSPDPVPLEHPASSTPPSPESPPSLPSPPIPGTSRVPYRTNLPCGLSQDVWRRIAAYAIDANGIMSEAQQDATMRWALDYRTLTTETESLGKPRSAQIWKVLDSIECLTYDIRT
ncbi:MAG: hypothetical protein Q9191_002004 [Dirinaria sp. TL-2023a]